MSPLPPREACGSPLRKPSLGLSIGTKECTRVYTLVYPRVHSCVHACTLPRSRYLRYGGVGEPLGRLVPHSPVDPYRVRWGVLTHSADSSGGEYRDDLAHPPLRRTRVGESPPSTQPLGGRARASVSYRRGSCGGTTWYEVAQGLERLYLSLYYGNSGLGAEDTRQIA